MSETPNWYRWQGDTLELWLKVQPKAKKDEFVEPFGDAYKVRITAPPVDGKANRHLTAFLARAFGVKRNEVELAGGDLSRSKRFLIQRPSRFPIPIKRGE
jgi:uncharacterized protein (TIGR00251 family)